MKKYSLIAIISLLVVYFPTPYILGQPVCLLWLHGRWRILCCSLTQGLAVWLLWQMEYQQVWKSRGFSGWAWAFALCQGREKNIPGVANGSAENENHVKHSLQLTYRSAAKLSLDDLTPVDPEAWKRNLRCCVLLLLCSIIVTIQGYSFDCMPQCWALSRCWIKICWIEPNWKCVCCLYGTFRARVLLKGPRLVT